MKRLVFISVVFLLVGLSAYGQDTAITEFDLYGCWTLERQENAQRPPTPIYKRCEDAHSKKVRKVSEISLLEFGKSEFQVSSQIFCFITDSIEGTWKFDSENRILKLYYPENYMLEFWEHVKEEYPEIEIPKQMLHAKYEVIGLVENQLELKKLRRTKSIANRVDKD